MERFPLIVNFNSTMVRLKGDAGLNPVLGDVFQFHYGTIKSGVVA